MDADGRNVRALTDTTGGILAAGWTPDSQRYRVTFRAAVIPCNCWTLPAAQRRRFFHPAVRGYGCVDFSGWTMDRFCRQSTRRMNLVFSSPGWMDRTDGCSSIGYLDGQQTALEPGWQWLASA